MFLIFSAVVPEMRVWCLEVRERGCQFVDATFCRSACMFFSHFFFPAVVSEVPRGARAGVSIC